MKLILYGWVRSELGHRYLSLHVSLHHFSFLSESMSPLTGNMNVLVHSKQIFVSRGQRSAFSVEERIYSGTVITEQLEIVGKMFMQINAALVSSK